MVSKIEKVSSLKTKRALTFWQGVNNVALQKLPLDLSSRQTVVLLHIYLYSEPHSIKNLADKLGISKPAICRAVDMLENARLVKRVPDRSDRRNVLISRTSKGMAFINSFADIIMTVSKKAA